MAVRKTSASRIRMRALERWSAVSLAITVPSPVQGEPRRRPAGRLLSGIARVLEIAIVDFVEARRGETDADELDLRGEASGNFGAQIALAVRPIEVGRDRLDAYDAGDRSEEV